MNPVWPIYLGRRCCIPTYPIYQGSFESEDDAVKKIDEIATAKNLVEKERLIEGEDENAIDTFYIFDVPVSFGKNKSYKDRQVSIVRL